MLLWFDKVPVLESTAVLLRKVDFLTRSNVQLAHLPGFAGFHQHLTGMHLKCNILFFLLLQSLTHPTMRNVGQVLKCKIRKDFHGKMLDEFLDCSCLFQILL